GGRIGLLLALTLAGDTLISLFLTTRADRLGRRRVLIVGALLMIGGAVVFLATDLFPLLLLGATIGVISPSGNEVGPFLPVEQASLSQTVSDDRRTGLFAWYNLAGSVATAVGALTAGLVAQAIQSSGATADSYRAIVAVYAGLGLVMALLFSRLGAA